MMVSPEGDICNSLFGDISLFFMWRYKNNDLFFGYFSGIHSTNTIFARGNEHEQV